ncbi:MAG: hypothetical protein GY832_23645 [Chloroflexi bacterium]|nr:hypothetical protein [Chloroflexota bacterium]
MGVYVIIINDRHLDVDVLLYSDREEAVDTARDLAKTACSAKEDYEELKTGGGIFFAKYSCEGDYIRVIERTVG